MQSVCDIVGTIWFRVPTSEVNSDEVKDSFKSTLKIPWLRILTWKLLLGDWITFLSKFDLIFDFFIPLFQFLVVWFEHFVTLNCKSFEMWFCGLGYNDFKNSLSQQKQIELLTSCPKLFAKKVENSIVLPNPHTWIIFSYLSGGNCSRAHACMKCWHLKERCRSRWNLIFSHIYLLKCRFSSMVSDNFSTKRFHEFFCSPHVFPKFWTNHKKCCLFICF